MDVFLFGLSTVFALEIADGTSIKSVRGYPLARKDSTTWPSLAKTMVLDHNDRGCPFLDLETMGMAAWSRPQARSMSLIVREDGHFGLFPFHVPNLISILVSFCSGQTIIFEDTVEKELNGLGCCEWWFGGVEKGWYSKIMHQDKDCIETL